MNRKRIIIYSFLIVGILCTWWYSVSTNSQTEFSEKVKVVLREVGNQLLLSQKDSTSLILPIKKLETFKYELSFEKELRFEPNKMVSIIETNFEKAQLSKQYRVEVLQCTDSEVAYSYEMSEQVENTIIPCSGRYVPNSCYVIQVRFTGKEASFWSLSKISYLCILLIFIALEVFFFKKKASEKPTDAITEEYATIGSFQFYPSQNKLIKQATEINLSKKECELLQIFSENLNQIVTRDELTKKVWEDNGVIVGRSLDTYISKLRKKLKDDERIQITNVHGVGYKLELES